MAVCEPKNINVADFKQTSATNRYYMYMLWLWEILKMNKPNLYFKGKQNYVVVDIVFPPFNGIR